MNLRSSKSLLSIMLAVVGAAAISGCAPSTYRVNTPTPSVIKFTESESNAPSFQLVDKRKVDEKVFSSGVLKAGLLVDGSPIDPVAYLEKNAKNELQARGITLNEASEKLQIDINKIYIKNHRSNGYAPFITMSYLSADVKTTEGNQRIAVFVKRGKVPVWSFNEIIEPTLNEPLSLIVKEFSAKLNQISYGHKISDQDVSQLVAEIKKPDGQSTVYTKVYDLGFGNNLTAVPALVELVKHEDEYVRLAAISSLGILKAKDQIENLKSIYQTASLWQERAMALKAIADMGTAESAAFLKQAQSDIEQSQNVKEKEWTSALLGLYLN